jgi:ferritin
MISKEMDKLINDQFNKELFSANLYLSMSSYFLSRDLDGFANFFRIQAKEEQMHAMKQFDYLHQVDSTIKMTSIAAPQIDFKSIIQVFELSLEHEKSVTASIYNIVEQALKDRDYATHAFFQWFITEQVEEESSIKTLIKKIEMIGDNSSALYLLNDELSKRSIGSIDAE